MTPLCSNQNESSAIHTSHKVKVGCRDVVGRRRLIHVILLPDNMIALIFPPGEIAVLGPDEVLELRSELRQAVFMACDALPEEAGPCMASPQNFLSAAIPCTDASGRAQAICVRSMSGQPVVLIAPAGGVAVLQPLQVGRMRATLRDVRAVALHRETFVSDVIRVVPLAYDSQRVMA